jgi:uncharacterized membrane protein
LLVDDPAAAPIRPGPVPRWLPWVSIATCLLGLGVSAYLGLQSDTGGGTVACPNTGFVNCQKVLQSAPANALGVPLPLVGLIFFLNLAIFNLPFAWRSSMLLLHLERLGTAVGGVAFVLYLIYAELYVVDAICVWCTAVHVLSVLLFGLTVLGTAHLFGGGSA